MITCKVNKSWCVFVNTKFFIVFLNDDKQIDQSAFIFSQLCIGVCMCDCSCTYVDGREVDVQYSNWKSGQPLSTFNCVAAARTNEWITISCDMPKKVVCQS